MKTPNHPSNTARSAGLLLSLLAAVLWLLPGKASAQNWLTLPNPHWNIKLTDAAYDKSVAEGTDLTNGARPLRRAIQKLIEDPLSEELLAGEWGEGDTVLCDVADGKFVFSHGTGEIPAPRPAGTLGGDTAPAAPHTGNAAPVSGGVTSGPGGMMQAGSGAL